MARTNREILTGGKKYANKKAKKHLVEEVVFNKDERNEYLTGFHKRKVERQKKAQEFHKKQDRLAKIEERKKIKLEKEKDMLEQLDKYQKNLKYLNGVVDSDDEGDDGFKTKTNGNDEDDDEVEEWDGFKDDEEDGPKGILKKKEVYGEEATEVTIEELPNDIEEIAKLNFVNLEKSKKVLEESIDRAQKYAVISGHEKPKQKKKKFRYLSKNERKQNNRKAINSKIKSRGRKD